MNFTPHNWICLSFVCDLRCISVNSVQYGLQSSYRFSICNVNTFDSFEISSFRRLKLIISAKRLNDETLQTYINTYNQPNSKRKVFFFFFFLLIFSHMHVSHFYDSVIGGVRCSSRRMQLAKRLLYLDNVTLANCWKSINIIQTKYTRTGWECNMML